MEKKQRKSDKQATARKPSREEEAKQVVWEYAQALRAIIEKFCNKLN